MAFTSTPVAVQSPKTYLGLLQNSTGAFTFAIGNTTTNLVSVVPSPTNATKIDAIFVTSTDTSTRDLVLYISNGTNLFLLGTVSIPANSAFTNALPQINILKNAQLPGVSYDAMGNPYLYVTNGQILYAGTLTAVTAAKQISVIATGGDF